MFPVERITFPSDPGNQLAPTPLVLSAGSAPLDFVAVPEPMTLVLFGAGLAGLALAGRRRSA